MRWLRRLQCVDDDGQNRLAPERDQLNGVDEAAPIDFDVVLRATERPARPWRRQIPSLSDAERALVIAALCNEPCLWVSWRDAFDEDTSFSWADLDVVFE